MLEGFIIMDVCGRGGGGRAVKQSRFVMRRPHLQLLLPPLCIPQCAFLGRVCGTPRYQGPTDIIDPVGSGGQARANESLAHCRPTVVFRATIDALPTHRRMSELASSIGGVGSFPISIGFSVLQLRSSHMA